MKIVMLDAATLGDDIGFDAIESIGELTVYKTTVPEQIPERIKNADVIVLNKLKLGAHNLGGTENLKLICVTATGYDNIDTDYCRKRGIGVANIVGYSTNSVAQLTIALALELVMRLPVYTKFVRSGEYTRSGVANRLEPAFCELAGKTWGIVGMGNIGKKVAKIAEAFGCRVICTKRKPEQGLTVVSLDELMRTADVISVHLPLSNETKGLISRELLSLMKPTAVIVNAARGAVFDEAALAELIENGSIAGAASDVYSTEPFGEEHPFYKIKDRENFVLTPHMAWGALEARMRCIDEVAANIRAYYAGEIRNRVEL